ncbi:MAG: hypothetical protein JSS49_13455 [Planctomycetes bacterium]|nr:hypothetical protein [Planctomycetota bacterium]
MSDPIPDLNEASTSAPGGLAVIVDFVANVVQLSASLGLALSLAGILCWGLFTTSQQFSRAARASRRAVQASPSPHALSEQLQSITRDSESQSRREQFVRQVQAAAQ